MHVSNVSIEDIDARQAALWNLWASPNGQLISPYLRHGFTACVARARSDVRIVVMRDDQGEAAFFPYHAPVGGVVRPIAAPMSDYQGLVARPGFRPDLTALLKATGGSALVYDNWHGLETSEATGIRASDGSIIIDLADGAEAYFAERRGAYKDHFKKSARRARAAARDVGELRVDMTDPDGSTFAQLLAWKQTQYRETGKLDVLSINWVRDVLDRLRRGEQGDCRGRTAALWFGDRLAAVEFGIEADGVYHSWFPAYDPELARYSPGLLLLHGIIESAQDHGISRIDLGRGEMHYKKYYASREVELHTGRTLVPGLAACRIRGWEYAEAAASVLPGKLAALPVRLRRRWAQVSAFEPRLGPRLASFAGSLPS
ncbi:GNAT family N-acetyltransferase [Maricaulis sp. CAU 1757]